MNFRNTLVPSSRNTVTWSMKVDVCDWRTVGKRLLYSWPSVTRRWARYMQLLWNSAETKEQGLHHKSLLRHMGFLQVYLWSKKPKAEEFCKTLNCNTDSSCYSLLSVGWTTTSLYIQTEGERPPSVTGVEFWLLMEIISDCLWPISRYHQRKLWPPSLVGFEVATSGICHSYIPVIYVYIITDRISY